MTPLEIKYPSGSTPLSPEERDGLIPDYITSHGDLNELEQENIQSAVLWARKKKPNEILEPGFLYELHRQMFGKVWLWAGRARTSGKNIGIDWHLITPQLGQLLADTRYWIARQTYPSDEIAARFHHRLVQNHAFPNGNGRHARMMTDLLLETHGQPPFSWGAKSIHGPADVAGRIRSAYIQALKAADEGRYELLLEFVRS